MPEYIISDGYFPELSPSQKFGAPRDGGTRLHEGDDLHYQDNAFVPGRMERDGWIQSKFYNDMAGYGISVIYDDGTEGLYIHIDSESYNLRKIGEFYKRGSLIAYGVKSGNSTANVLHYEKHLNGIPVNPQPYIRIDNMINFTKEGKGQVKVGADIKDIGGSVTGRVDMKDLTPVEGRDDVGQTFIYAMTVNPKDKGYMYRISSGGDNWVSKADFIGVENTEAWVLGGIYIKTPEIIKVMQRQIDSLEADNEHLNNNADEAIKILENK